GAKFILTWASAAAGKDAGSEIARTPEREVSARLGGRVSGKIAEESPVGRTGETGTRQCARIPCAYAVDRPGHGLAVEIADRERSRVVAEIVGVGEPSGGEVASSAVYDRSECVAAEASHTGRRQGDARYTGDPGIDVRS